VGAVSLSVALVLLAGLPLLLPDYPLYVATLTLVYSLAALGLNLTLGYAGQVSLAQGAFIGIGAYGVALLTARGAPFLLALAAGGILAFACGLLLGYPALKVKHHYLAMVTMGFNIIAFLLMRNEEWLTGGNLGLSGIRRPALGGLSFAGDRAYYLLVLGVTAVATAVAAWMVRSPWGRGLRAIRENELRAEALGVNLRNYKLAAFAAGALYGGIAGGLFAPLLRYIDPHAFGLERSIQLLLMVVVGGLGRFAGPFIGAAVITVLPEALRMTQGLYLIFFSLLVMLLVLFRPQGLAAVVDALRSRAGIPAMRSR
jgi:branched-chain amino acid transport system permease protein